MKRIVPTTALCAALVAALAVAGCGSSSSKKSSSTSSASPTQASSTPAPAPAPSGSKKKGGSGGKSSNLKLAADSSGALKFNKTTLKASKGNVTIVMSNPSTVPHAIAIKGGGVTKKGQVVTGGGTSKITASLKPGKYEFYCPVDGHEAAGMKGTLTVK